MMAYLANDFQASRRSLCRRIWTASSERQLTHLERRALDADWSCADVERFTYKSADGWDVDGFLVKPIGWQAGKKYPMILSIHGGPAGQYGVDWYHEFQVYAAKGYAVFFYESARLHRLWPEVRARHRERMGRQGLSGHHERRGRGAQADIRGSISDRMGVTGGSYGGFMTNWIVGHTDRFKAAVTLRSVSNFISATMARATAPMVTRTISAATSFENSICTGTVAAEVCEEREDADADSAFGQRLSRADRAGRTMVSRAEALTA